MVLVILNVALVGIAWSISAGIRASALAARQYLAVSLAQAKIEECRLGGGFTPGSETGDFSPDHPDYNWQADVSGPDQSGLYRLEVAATWKDRGLERRETLVTYICNATEAPTGATP